MTNSAKKAKEYWIVPESGKIRTESYRTLGQIHVIEYSAIKPLQDEIDRLRLVLKESELKADNYRGIAQELLAEVEQKSFGFSAQMYCERIRKELA